MDPNCVPERERWELGRSTGNPAFENPLRAGNWIHPLPSNDVTQLRLRAPAVHRKTTQEWGNSSSFTATTLHEPWMYYEQYSSTATFLFSSILALRYSSYNGNAAADTHGLPCWWLQRSPQVQTHPTTCSTTTTADSLLQRIACRHSAVRSHLASMSGSWLWMKSCIHWCSEERSRNSLKDLW